ncbi:MAG: LPS assembly lipoprotein LptE [Candidatus Omnitrophica bacterium]|nr:LPS assembly lipoprotein LptE [Candidatus Omnitrophota bacterium]
MQKWFLLFSLVLLSGCSYTLVKPSARTVYVKVFANNTLQPKIESYVYSEIKQTLVEREGFEIVNNPGNADIIIGGTITDFTRGPDFFSNTGEIQMASYTVKITLAIQKNNKTTKQIISTDFHLPLIQNFNLDLLLTQISNKVADKIYFLLLKNYA